MSKVKKLCFQGETIFCGLDVHKTNWKVNLRIRDMELANFSQDPDAVLLSNYLKKNYPQAAVEVVYEAGFCGFEAQRSLTRSGLKCIVVNAADVPASDKERKRKDDKRDARKLSRELAEGSLQGIYIPDKQMEHARSLVRQRHRLVQDQTRCKNRIKHLLLFSGLQIKDTKEHWSKKYIKELQELVCENQSLKTAIKIAIDQYLQLRNILKEATLAIRTLSKQPLFAPVQKWLQSICGVGLINGMVIQTEVQDIHRFKTLDRFCDYAGLVPDIYSTNDKITVRGITHRRNEFLREAIVESSWMLIRKDPAMLMKYNTYRNRMNQNKAIVRVGKHLLSRIRYVWGKQKEYEKGIVQ